MARTVELDLELVGVRPRIWRRLRVPADTSLRDLHHAIQILLSWEDRHLHVFDVGRHEYGPRPEEEWEREQWAGDDEGISVAKALAEARGPIHYWYDFGDDWQVTISPRAAADEPGRPTATCLAGERAGPPEDLGGPHAYQRLLDRPADASDRAGDDEAVLPDGFDPAAFDVVEMNRRLARAFRPRATPDRPAGADAAADAQQLAMLSLATLYLGSRHTKHGQREASKTLRGEILDALHDADLIFTNPQRKTVILTEAGQARARAWLAALPPLP
jgi:Plasmid pRiA4b ORF-3-like protein